MKSSCLTAAQATVQFLKQQFVERDGMEHRFIAGVFGIFGHGNVAGLGQAISEYGGKELPFHQPKSEQAMVHIAAAYAKAKRRLSTFACTTSIGPGATNMITGAAGATINRVPVLLLPGDVFASRIPDPVLQQLEHFGSRNVSVNDCFKPVSRYWDRISRPEQLLQALPEAMRVLTDPAETGAVTLAFPQDVQAEKYDYPENFFGKRVYSIPRVSAPKAAIEQAVALITNSKRPLVIAGGGVRYSEAEETLRKFVETFGVPVAVTQAGKGAIPDEHPLSVGAVGATGTLAANRLAAKADVVLLIGTRLSDFTTASKTAFQYDAVRFVGINICPMDAFKQGALPLIGDAREVLVDLTAELSRKKIAFPDQNISKEKKEWERERQALLSQGTSDGLLTQARVIHLINEHVGESGTIVHAAGGLPGDLHKLWISRHADDYHSEYGYSCMGYEIAGAIGVKMAQPKRRVYAMVGDGSYLMLSSDLATAVQEKIPVVVILLDNHGYQCIERLQTSLGGESFGNNFTKSNGEILPIDYAQNAKSLGAAAFRAVTEKDLKLALEKADHEEGPSLIHIPIAPDAAVPGFESWWDVPVAEVSGQPKVKKASEKYKSAKAKQRFLYS